MISATILKDSTNWLGNRLTTLELKYPRYIHSEFMTHRVLSKNSASSRAIPFSKIVEDIKANTIKPIWTKAKKGMQGEIIVEEELITQLNGIWEISQEENIWQAERLYNLGIHKQNLNRLLEPFFTMKVICTGTEWDNFFELRNHEDAQPEIHELAQKILFAMATSEPEYLNPGEWHLPFSNKIEDKDLINYDKSTENIELKISVARCARISYLTHDGQIDYKKDLELYDRLVANNPKHLSPTEHQARVPFEHELKYFESKYEFPIPTESIAVYKRGKYTSNLNGWIQYRKLIENETYR